MSKKKKTTILTISRAFIQVIMFVFLPSLYISALMGIKEIYTSAIHNELSADILPYLIEILATIPITIIFGRFFCGWMCAFGSFTDFIYKITEKVVPRKRLKEEVDAVLKYMKYVLLAFIVIVIWSFNVEVFNSTSPWDAFGMIFTIGKLPDISYVISYLTVGFILLILIMIASAFIERFFCRYLCPMGAVFAFTSLLRIGKIRKPTKECGKCRICTNNCAMGIPLYKYDEVTSPECINCMKCVTSCPRNNTSYAIVDKDIRPLIAGCASIAVMTGTYYVGNITANASGVNTSISTEASNAAGTIYNNGTYEGSGTGFRGQTTTVSVTIQNDTITNIETVSYGDDKEFYDRAFTNVTGDIISSQSTDVDVVSGATYSSNGIMEAVENALNSAKIDSSSSVNSNDTASAGTDNSSQSESTDNNTNDSSNKSSINDDSNSPSSDANSDSDAKSFEGKHKGYRGDQGSFSINDSNNSSTDDSNNTSTDDSNNTFSNDSSSTNSDSSSSNSTSSNTSESGNYKDGTYEGSGTGFRGATTTVSVTVSGAKITDISVVSYGDDRPFFTRAYDTVSEEIITSQSTNVDSVSGATFSSNGIMEAVADALSNAVE